MQPKGVITAEPNSLLENPKQEEDPQPPAPPEPPGATSGSPVISVIIPAHNEERYLERTLNALARQTYLHRETIVVANGCTDLTEQVAARRCNRLVVLSQKSLGVSRNLGARLARGDLLLFLDADTTLEPMALKTIARNFTKKDAVGTLKGRPDADNWQYRLIYACKNFTHSSSLHAGSSGVIVCWRKLFMEIGGFDEGLEVRENSDLIYRLKRFGRYKYLGEVAATTSMRRYHQRGFTQMIWLWVKLWFHTKFGDLHHRPYETVR